MRSLLSSRRFQLLLIGQVVSMAGDSVLLIVLAIWVKSLTGSSGLASLVVLVVNLPSLITPLLGWVVDRFRRKPFLIWLYLIAVVALLPMYAVHGADMIWIVYLVSAGYGVIGSMSSAALSGLVKVAVPGDEAADANGLLRSVQESLRLVGPLAGAGLYAWAGMTLVVLVDIATFAVAVVTLAALRISEDRPETNGLHWRQEVLAGFQFLLDSRSLRRASLALGAGFLVFGAVTPGVFAFVSDGLHRPATFVGVLLTVLGLGSVAGALLSPSLIRRSGEQFAMSVGLLAMAAGVGALVYPRLWLGFAAAIVAGFGVAVTTVSFATLRQRVTPAALMGRVSTATDVLVVTPQTISMGIGAGIIAVIDFRWIFGLAAASLLAAGFSLRLGRRAGRSSGTLPLPATEPESTG